MSAHLRRPRKTLGWASFGLALFLLWAFWFLLGWPWWWCWWAAFSVVTLLAYGLDKWQSKTEGEQRIPELVLHLLTLAGGVTGAWIGRLVFRHKTRHISFTVVLVLATVLHLGLWYFVVHPRLR